MKRVLYLFLVMVFCIFTTKIEAKKKRHSKHKSHKVAVPEQKSFQEFIPTLDPEDEKWEWMDRQVRQDFEGIEAISVAKLRSDFAKMPNYIRCYEIRNGEVVGPSDNIADFLRAIITRYPLPDLVFLYVYLDIIRSHFFTTYNVDSPLFCSAKARDTQGKVIHFIDWYYHISKIGAGKDAGWNQMISEIDAHSVSWDHQLPKLFWRGGTTDYGGMGLYHSKLIDFPRGRLVQMSLDDPDLIDAKFTWLGNSKKQKHFPRAPHASIAQHLAYKYQIVMDGETATYPGYQWRLYSGCLSFKQASNETMWFYGALLPYVHYVPVQRNLEDLERLINWAIWHDVEAREIAENARLFAKENLLPEHMLLYGYKVLKMYASKLEE